MDNPYIRLHLKVNGEWRPFLRIPRTEFPRLTTRPLKWLRFLGWCIYGQTGELRTVVNGNQVQDDHTTGFLSDYYYVSPSMRYLFFLKIVLELLQNPPVSSI
ncbi:hypothetical protein C8F01DRAFT_1259831 [Mycena amicta]|nr:hypothetical protein C8F01DRAFT_1259831 [Mycena amicta]